MRRNVLRLLSSFRSTRAEHELTREIRAHLQLLEDQYIAKGMSAEEAHYAALRAFGGVEQVKEQQREARMFRWLAALPMDLKLGGRKLMKYPGLTLIGGVAMSFAIWVGIVIFQVVGLFVHPTLPLSQGARLVQIRNMDLTTPNEVEEKVLHDFLDWRESLRAVTHVGAWRNSSRNLVVADGDTRPVNVAEMSVSGFQVADGDPLMGRVLVEADERPEAPPVAVIGHEIWQTRFGGDPNVLGRDVQLGDEHFTVIGVMREGYEFPVSHDVWIPFKTALLDQKPRSGPSLNVFALLAPGETMESAQAELTIVGRRAAAEWPVTHQHLEPHLRPYAMILSVGGSEETPIMYATYVVMIALVILICGNVGLLLFARAASREADLVVRTALGASRGRIVAQMFAEALVLGGVAAIAGVAAADYALRTWAVTFLETNMGRLPFWFDLSLSPRTFAVALALTVTAAAVAGVMPALKITRGMSHRLKQTSAGSGGLQFGGVWTVVIVAQVAATVVFPAIVYVERYLVRGVEEFNPGFATEQYLAVKLERDYPVDDSNADPAVPKRNTQLVATLEQLRDKMAAQPAVGSVTFAEDLPTTNHPNKAIEMGYDVDGTAAPAAPSGEPPLRQATIAAVHPLYFEAIDAPILAGRGFRAVDAAPGARVVIVDQGFVDQVLQGRNAVGQQVRFRYAGPVSHPWSPADSSDPDVKPGDWYEVIGVVPELGVGAPTQKGRAAGFYIPTMPDQFDQVYMMVHVRGGDPMTLVPQLREAAADVDPSLRLTNLQRLSEANSDVTWTMTLWMRMTAVLSGVAIVLSLAGIFAVLSFTVARRTREIGVRVALGASRHRVVFATFRRPLFQVALGVVVGIVIVFTGAVLLRGSELPGFEGALSGQAMMIIVLYAIAMLGVCMLGCVVPTRRALNIEPTSALRTE